MINVSRGIFQEVLDEDLGKGMGGEGEGERVGEVRIFSGRKLKRELRRSPRNKTLIRRIDMFCTVREHGAREGRSVRAEPTSKYYWQGCDKDYGSPIKVRKIIKDEQRRNYFRSVPLAT